MFDKNRTRKVRRLRNCGFVTFAKCYQASCALINRKKFVNLFSLHAADTWLQPDYDEGLGDDLYNSDESSDLFKTLNDDCLLHIIAQLDVLDILNLKKVCRKFEQLVKINLRSIRRIDFARIKPKKKITLHEARNIFKSIGKPITVVNVNSEKFYGKRILNFIPKFIPDVKHLKLNGFNLESSSFWDTMSKILTNIETLDLSDNSEINEQFLRKLDPSGQHLKSLSVANSNINGQFLKTLPLVRCLNVSGCRFINGRQINEFIARNNNLTSLNMAKCTNIYGQEMNELLQNFKNCESLSLNNYYIDEISSRFVIPNINTMNELRDLTICNINFPPSDQLLRTINFDSNKIECLNISSGSLTLTSVYAISTMRKLKKLVMNFKNAVPDDIVDYLVELEYFEELHISCCSYVSPMNALRLFSMPKFHLLDVSRCYGYSNEFVCEVVEVLRERRADFITEIIVGQTEINQNVVNDERMKNYRKFLLLNWDTAKDVEHDYDIDEENNRSENISQQEHFTLDDIINILSTIDECDPKLVDSIKKFL